PPAQALRLGRGVTPRPLPPGNPVGLRGPDGSRDVTPSVALVSPCLTTSTSCCPATPRAGLSACSRAPAVRFVLTTRLAKGFVVPPLGRFWLHFLRSVPIRALGGRLWSCRVGQRLVASLLRPARITRYNERAGGPPLTVGLASPLHSE